MIDNKDLLRRVYEDEIYWRFVNKGYSHLHAKIKAFQLVHKVW
jgi:hypothetical protein